MIDESKHYALAITCGAKRGPKDTDLTFSPAALRDFLQALEQQPAAREPIPEGMILVPYEPSIEMQEQGATASGYDLSQKRARHVYQTMIDMYVVRNGAELTDQWFRAQAGYAAPQQKDTP